MSRPLILVTNDDGITAAGISALAQHLDVAGEVLVVTAAGDFNESLER